MKNEDYIKEKIKQKDKDSRQHHHVSAVDCWTYHDEMSPIVVFSSLSNAELTADIMAKLMVTEIKCQISCDSGVGWSH